MPSPSATELFAEAQAIDAAIRTAMAQDGKITSTMERLEKRLVSRPDPLHHLKST